MSNRVTVRSFLAFPFVASALVLICGGVVVALPFIWLALAIGGDDVA